MLSHTCTVSISLLFRCDLVCLEASKSYSLSSLVHRRLLPVLVNLKGYMLTSFRLVHHRTTSYWEGSAMIPIETSYTTFRIVTDSTNQHKFFQCFMNITLIFLSLFNKPKQTACYLQPLIRLEYIYMMINKFEISFGNHTPISKIVVT